MGTKSFIKSSPMEKMIYGFGDIGANLCWTFMSMYVTMYYTDNVGIAGAVAGTMMLAARLLDGISDVVFAAVIDKCHMKLGKIRPWFLIAAPMLGISLYASFHVPLEWGIQPKTIYVFITYTFTAAVSYTIYNLAYSAILPLMSMEEKDRSTAATIGRFITTGGVTVMYMVTPILLAMWGGERSDSAWGMISTVYAIICTILVFLMGVIIKEKERPEKPETAMDNDADRLPEKVSFIDNLKVVLSTKYTWLLLGLFLLFYFFSGVSSVRTYYYRDVLGNLELFSMGSTLASLPSLFALILVPFLFKKIERKKAVMAGLGIFCAASIVWTLFSGSVTAAYICTVIMSLAWTPLTAVVYVYIADLVDYIWMKTGKRVEGVAAMASSIGTKLGTGLGSAIIGWGLTWCSYDGTLSVQSSGTQTGIVLMTTGLPLLIGALSLIILFFWDIDKKKEKLRNV